MPAGALSVCGTARLRCRRQINENGIFTGVESWRKRNASGCAVSVRNCALEVQEADQ
jgi:hypothetical protein